MKLNTSLIIASTSLTASVQAFAPSANNNAFMKRQLLGGDRIKDVVRGCPLYAMSETEIAALKAQAAKAREEADRLAKVCKQENFSWLGFVCGCFIYVVYGLIVV